MPLTDEQMTAPKAIAPFEIALIFEAWAQARDDEPHSESAQAIIDVAGGPPCRLSSEDPATFGRRMAEGIFTLLKEV